MGDQNIKHCRLKPPKTFFKTQISSGQFTFPQGQLLAPGPDFMGFFLAQWFVAVPFYCRNGALGLGVGKECGCSSYFIDDNSLAKRIILPFLSHILASSVISVHSVGVRMQMKRIVYWDFKNDHESIIGFPHLGNC